MKKLVLKIILAGLLWAAPAMAQDFQSTSTLRGSGSQYAPQVTPVGAVSPIMDPTVGATGSSDINHRRNSFINGPESGQSDESPVGDAWVMLAFAAAACGIVFLRRRKVQKAENK